MTPQEPEVAEVGAVAAAPMAESSVGLPARTENVDSAWPDAPEVTESETPPPASTQASEKSAPSAFEDPISVAVEAEAQAIAAGPSDAAPPSTGAEAAAGAEGEGESEAPSADDDESEGESGDAEAGDAEAADATAPGAAKKKRRRRRRKKKPEANAGSGDASPPQRESIRPHRASDRAPFHVGEEVFGKVTAVLDTAIMVDLSGKALAILDRTEMEVDDLVPAVSDRLVARVHNDGSRGGLVVLTRKPLREEETKPKLEQAAKDGQLVGGLITGVIKGGVEVDIGGVRAFAPASGMDLHPGQANFAGLVGQRLDFKITSFDKGGRDVVVTRRPMLEAEAHERRKRALSLLTEGQVLEGVVRTVVEWGAFVALPEAENLEGLVHVSEASHDTRRPLNELVNPGDRFPVKITKIDERGKIWLSRKALLEDPWGQAKRKYAPHTKHLGKVTRLEKLGAYIELEPEIEGALAVADLSLERVEHSSELLKEGQEIEVVVSHVDPRTRRIVLHGAPTPEQANEAPQKIVRNALVKAKVVKGEAAGVIVRVLGITGRAQRGFIPAGQTGTARGTDLRKVFKPGTQLDLKVLDVDPRTNEPKLSIRGFKEDEERRAHKEYRQKLKEEGGFGTLGDLLREKLALSKNAGA
jgi:small subunit ribosomal protein S1